MPVETIPSIDESLYQSSAPAQLPVPPAEAPPEAPYYALSEEEIRGQVARAFVDAEARQAAAVEAGEKPPAPLVLVVSVREDELERGQIQDPYKARVMAEAEKPYREEIAVKERKQSAIVDAMKHPEKWWALVSEPIKSAKWLAEGMSAELLHYRAHTAAMLAGLKFDRMVEAAKPYVPHIPISETIRSLVESSDRSKPVTEVKASAAEVTVSSETDELVTQLKLDSQLGEQLQILENGQLLERLSTGELGIRGHDGAEYPAPTPQQIRQLVEQRRDDVKHKAAQGFSRMLLVPQAVPTSALAESLKQSVIAHYQQGALRNNAGERIVLHDPGVRRPETYDFVSGADQLDELQAATADDEEPSLTPGWKVVFVKNMPELPHRPEDVVVFAGRGEFSVGRRSGKDSIEALKTSPVCQGEKGFDARTWLTYALTEMERTGTAVDYDGGTLLLGSRARGQVFTHRTTIPWIGWNRQFRKGRIRSMRIVWGAAGPGRRQESVGIRTSVELS